MMKRKEKKEEKEARIYGMILVASVLIIAGFLIFSNWKIAERKQELLQQIKALQGEIEGLERKNQGLEAGISASEQSDYLEAKIREQGYKKPGETAVIIKKEQPAEQGKEAPKNIWERFLAEVKGIIK